ncbi:cob(I)yrinic acid a,c-diamide adenosyltransferase [Candidatus Gottesmanbacteria bacterium]|nr:cob(I)yrinic acid a,c-diamide adenosyltransferase [Candidatus Gottesmanbacteria bacterium]
MARLKIYTRTGDRGQTSLYGGKRVPKSHYRVNAYGTIDELNSLLGIVLSKIDDDRVRKFIHGIQHDLFVIGGHLAGAKVELGVLKTRVDEMEKLIDWMDSNLSSLKSFILPDGTEASTFLFFTRAVARRSERELVALSLEEKVDERVLIYLNRLSDLLFMMGRYLNYKASVAETPWKSKIE